VQEGDCRREGRLHLIDGNPAPHDILARARASRRWPTYLVNEIQEVYRLQGVNINDKHIEVIVRQMLQKVEIVDAGDTDVPGWRAGRPDRVRASQRASARRRQARRRPGTPVLLGHHQGLACRRAPFISAASFQETTRVLTEAAVNGKVDHAARASRRTSSSAA
jgi:DNA-directed RNA polymerase subunit beta'